MPTSPPVLTAAPDSPDRSDRATFAARAIALDDFTKNVHIPELQLAINAAYTNAVESAGSAAAAGAILWVSGTTYAIGNARISPTDFQTYRRKTAGAGTTDPNLDGTNWALVNVAKNSVTRSARTSNTALAEVDRGSLIDITSGTFSQTFAAAATLGSGWYCYLRNSGTGDITLDPNASELIDGLTTFVMYPGETRLVQCDGAALYSVVLTSFYKVFTSSGTFTKPPGYGRFGGHLIAGGACGNGTVGGGGGSGVQFSLEKSLIGATQAVTIAGATTYPAGTAGNTSTFVFSVFGGQGGTGGYAFSAAGTQYSNVTATAPAGGEYAGGSGSASYGGASLYGGGGGAASSQIGLSAFAGAGGLGAGAGVAPGGGGGSTGGGARGELRIWGEL